MDDPDKMDLTLTSDFDSSLLTCWDSGGTSKNETKEGGGNSMSRSPRSNHSGVGDTGVCWDGNGNASPGFSQLPSFTMEEEVQKFGSAEGRSSELNNNNNNNNHDNHNNTDDTGSTNEKETSNNSNSNTTNDNNNDGSVDGTAAASWQSMMNSNKNQPTLSSSDAAVDSSNEISHTNTHTNTARTDTSKSPVPVSTTASVASGSAKDGGFGASVSSTSSFRHHNKSSSQQNDLLLSFNNAKNGICMTSPLQQHHHQQHDQHQHQHHHNSTVSNHTSVSLHTALDSSQTTQMHPLAIPSSANCPPHVVTGARQGDLLHAQMQTVAGLQNAFFPMGLNSLGAASFAAAGMTLTANNNNNNNNNTSTNHTNHQNSNNGGQQHHQQQQQQQQLQLNHNGLLFSPSQIVNIQQQQAEQQQQQQQQPQQQNSDNNNNNTAGISATPPPFYLFDAPVELRVNFMQSQRMHGLPVTEDSNSYHYGVSVNGFHPQLNAQMNPATLLGINSVAHGGGGSSNASSSLHHPQLVDARHGNRKAGRIKNEREQRRAQKITELIDQLREKMETGGWKVEVKSKFHTLSSCADYVKHLIKETAEKEEAVNKAKSDLQMKERKVEEEKALQESRSDPESVMSSLTSSTGDDSRAKKVSSDHSSDDGQRKRKLCSDGSSSSNKKSRNSNSGHSGSSESSAEGQGCKRSNQLSLDKTTSSVSDITDSNKDSSNSGSDTQNSNQRSDDDDESGTPSSISASSSAAVVQGRHGKKHRTKHADVVIKGRNTERQHKLSNEVTSLEESFVLDYEEVFTRSNVPQLIATTAGKIIAWNDFFLKATGMSKAGVKGLTIFSLVKQERLSNLFEIVAKALRKDPTSSSSEGGADGSQSETNWDYAAMTLPCIDFPSNKERSRGKKGVSPLFITVTLMADEDPRNRLFHCVFTDCPGTNGALGSITPELLSMLFTRHHRKSENSESREKSY